jgi:hypothetical protein
MPFSVFPKFRATSAVLSSKIDAVIREMAALLNGGLGAANVKVGTAFPLASFSESKSVYAMRAALITSGTKADADDGEHYIGTVKYAGRIIGIGARFRHRLATAAAPYAVRVWSSAGGGAEVASVALEGTLSGTMQGYAMLDPAVAVAAGDVLKVIFERTVTLGEVIVFLDADHQG